MLAVPMEAKAPDNPEQKKLRRKAQQMLKSMGFDEPAVQRAADALRPKHSHRNQIQRIVERLGLAPNGDIANLWISLNDAFGRVHERSFHESLRVDDSFRAEYAHRFETIIRQLLVQLQSRYTALMHRAKEIAGMPPAQGIKLFVSEIPGAVQLHGYFYDNLQSEDWLPWLAKEGLLAEPLPDFQIANVLRLWTWPAGRYLVRMAASPRNTTRMAVSNAIRSLRSSRNPDVHHFGIEVVEALPTNEAAELVDVVCNWLTSTRSPFLSAPQKLIATLAKGGHTESALRVAQSLFRVFENENKLTALFEDAMYEHYVSEAVSHLAKSDPFQSLTGFCELLREASLLETRFRGLKEEDYSHYFPSFFAEEASSHDIHGALIISVARLAKAAVNADPHSVIRVHDILGGYKSRIYRRMQLYVLGLAPQEAPELAESYLMDPTLLDSDWCKEEYAALARAWFPSLEPNKQKIILDAVDTIPTRFFDRWKERYKEGEGSFPTSEDERRYWAISVRDLLWDWKDALPLGRRRELEEIANEFGDPSAWRNSHFGQEMSPLSRSSIQSQPLDETLAYLSSWLPDPGLQIHTISALSNELRESAAADPALFSNSAEKFGHLRPLLIRRMLEGVRQAATNGSDVNWSQLQALAIVVLERSKTPLDSSDSIPGDDSDWSLTLGTIVDLLATRLRRDIKAAEFEEDDAVEPLVLSLCERIARLSKPSNDRFDPKHPYFSAQQTSYGGAIELSVLLLYWLSKNPLKQPRKTLANNPKICEIFDSALDDRSAAGRIPRAIFGRYLGGLFHLGEAWVREQLPKLFPSDNIELRESTWIAHVQSDTGPVGPLTDEMLPLYSEHVARLNTSTDPDISDNRFSEFLMVLYLWDRLPEELLQQFWALAPTALRRHAMWFMGRELGGSNEEYKSRAISYWDRRLQLATRASNPAPYRKELGTLGQWFLWNVDHTWLMNQLLMMLKAGFSPNDGLGIIDKLAEHISGRVDQIVEITHALIKCSEIDRWILASQSEALRRILIEGKQAESPETREGVREIIGFLSSRGNTAFLDLA
ncbi:hypothetical protein [Bradyrhizobium ottawaense]|uniref:hypothetical protein n=1 Tax=Bradyrhizobium ottawaense TaxID=931866 RepID=UPI001177B5A6|nr:hypothetical protein [Bradyrhizobium ottawaense]